MKNKTYDKVKATATLGLPAIGSLYFGLSEIWGLPGTEAVLGTIAVVNTFMGVVLRIWSTAYFNSDAPYDGQIVTTKTEDGKINYGLELGVDPAEIEKMKAVSFKIQPPSPISGGMHVNETLQSTPPTYSPPDTEHYAPPGS